MSDKSGGYVRFGRAFGPQTTEPIKKRIAINEKLNQTKHYLGRKARKGFYW